jgi:HEAT repeats
MNDSKVLPDERLGGPSRPPLGEDLLPPVERPSARFIIQLFVAPALIVIGIVAVWLLFNWLVRQTSAQPKDLIKGLEQGARVARWQRASELANMLRNKRYADFKRDGSSAAHLAQILDREIDQGGMEDDDVEFRNFLARALGEFEVLDGVDVLLTAAATNRDAREQKVRDAALQAIARRAYNLQQLDPPQQLEHADLEKTLEKLAGDDDPAIRMQTAYALSQVNSSASIKRLEAMVNDADLDTRANAAIALAHRGNAAAVSTLADLLDLDELTHPTKEKNGQVIPSKLVVFVQPAMAAAQTLSRQNPKADQAPVVAALERLANADTAKLREALVPPRVTSDAQQSLDLLKSLK